MIRLHANVEEATEDDQRTKSKEIPNGFDREQLFGCPVDIMCLYKAAACFVLCRRDGCRKGNGHHAVTCGTVTWYMASIL